jgi:hypothetical protein
VPRNSVFRTRIKWLSEFLFVSTLALSTGASKHIRIIPRYVPGQTLRYRVESRTTTSGKITTPIVNPEGATQSTLTVRLLVRLEVLDAPAAGAAGSTRFRATYEEARGDSQSDAFDPAQPSPGAEYARLEGRSLEFMAEPGGHARFEGLEDIFPSRATAQAALSWFDALFFSSGFPEPGIAIGEKWKYEHRVGGVPFSDLVWHAESTYLRDEPCPSSEAGGGTEAPATEEACAVILTRFTISRSGSAHSDATSEDYLHNGLRVFGVWTGSGERLESVSLSRGLLIRSTETSDEQMDYQITSAANGSSIHNRSHARFQSETTLVSVSSLPAIAPR